MVIGSYRTALVRAKKAAQFRGGRDCSEPGGGL